MLVNILVPLIVYSNPQMYKLVRLFVRARKMPINITTNVCEHVNVLREHTYIAIFLFS